MFDGIDPKDIKQGSLGVCYYLSTISSLIILLISSSSHLLSSVFIFFFIKFLSKNNCFAEKIDRNLINNLLFRKVLLHPKFKDEISYEKYPKFVEVIDEYKRYINFICKLLELKTTLPTDIIKYEIMKYI